GADAETARNEGLVHVWVLGDGRHGPCFDARRRAVSAKAVFAGFGDPCGASGARLLSCRSSRRAERRKFRLAGRCSRFESELTGEVRLEFCRGSLQIVQVPEANRAVVAAR